MSANQSLRQLARSLWRSSWPLWMLLAFVGLAATRLLPPGYPRALAAAPIMLIVPGALTLGALCGARRPLGPVLFSLGALLSVAWWVFASLALYLLGVRISANSTYSCLLAVSAVLAFAAEARLWRSRPGKDRGVARGAPGVALALPTHGQNQASTRPSVGVGGFYAATAVLFGLSLLGGGAYAIDHLPRPAPVGYTFMAWSGRPVEGVFSVGQAGLKLPFDVVHHQPDKAVFRLEAVWLGTPSRVLAGPLTVTIGSDQTFRGALYVPPIHRGCTYRIVLTLTEARQRTSSASQSWSINADVRDAGKPPGMCKP
jgi:hypothetical protein